LDALVDLADVLEPPHDEVATAITVALVTALAPPPSR
jgi:hypothetical protein